MLQKLEGRWPWIPRELQQFVDGQFLLKLTLEITKYFANKQDHVMKEKQSNTLHQVKKENHFTLL